MCLTFIYVPAHASLVYSSLLLSPPPPLPSSSLPSSPSNSFYINSSTGEIQTAVILNRELVEQYNLAVTAVDSDTTLSQRRSSTVQVSVTGESQCACCAASVHV